MNNLYIGGFSGIGKTTVSKLLAEELNKKYISIDVVVENYIKMPIPLYIKKYGLQKMRNMFESILGTLITVSKNSVIDLSGGISDSINLTNQNTIMLLSSKELILERYKIEDKNDKNRLAKNMDKELFDRVFENKINGYKRIGKHFVTVEIDDSPHDIKNKILKLIS